MKIETSGIFMSFLACSLAVSDICLVPHFRSTAARMHSVMDEPKVDRSLPYFCHIREMEWREQNPAIREYKFQSHICKVRMTVFILPISRGCSGN